MNTHATSLDFEIRSIAEDFDATARVLEQLGALFMAISKPESVRRDELALLGCYMADNWAQTVEAMSKQASQLADSAKEKATVAAVASR